MTLHSGWTPKLHPAAGCVGMVPLGIRRPAQGQQPVGGWVSGIQSRPVPQLARNVPATFPEQAIQPIIEYTVYDDLPTGDSP